MKAQDILDHCKAVCEGRIPQPLPFWVEADSDGLVDPQYVFYYAKPQDDAENHIALILWGFPEQISPHYLQLAARILGLDKPEIVLYSDSFQSEWERCKASLGDISHWTVGDHGNLYGAFLHGWYGRANEAAYQQMIPPAEIVLEWVEDEYSRPVSEYNGAIRCMCYFIAPDWFAHVEVGGVQLYHFDGGKLPEAQQWCAKRITEIVTQTPQL